MRHTKNVDNNETLYTEILFDLKSGTLLRMGVEVNKCLCDSYTRYVPLGKL